MSLHDRINDWLFDLGSPPEKTDLEYQIIEIALKQGKAIAVQEYKKRTGSSTRKSWAQVKKILWLHPEVSLTPYRMTSWQRFVYNWRDLLTLIVLSGLLGLLLTWWLVRLGDFLGNLGN